MSSVVEQAKKVFTKELDEATKTILDRWEEHVNTIGIEEKGGPGSGHHGHSGLPEVHGGSRPEGVAGFKVIESTIAIPSDVPDSWLIFNAYRPIAGTLKASGGGTTWIDHKAPNGKHLAAVDPNDPLKDMWLKANKRDQAVLLRVNKSNKATKKEYVEEKQLPITDEDKAKLFQLRREMFFDRSDELAEQLFTGEISIGEWQETFKDSLRQYYSSAAAIGKGGWDEMSWADWGRLGPVMKDQYGYLQKYAEYISENRDTVSLKYIKARSRLYGEGAGFGAALIEAGTVFEHLLPFLPRDGSTECLNRCHCRWENVIFDREGQWFHVRSTWYLGEADHCATCLSRSGRLGTPRVVVVNRVHENVKVPAVIGGY